MNKMRKNNQVTIIGEVVSTFTFNHKTHGERFFATMFSVERESGVKDVIPVMMSEHLLDVTKDYCGEYFEIQGEFRSFNRQDGTRKMELFVFAQEVKPADCMVQPAINNEISLFGTICKEPAYRITPLGREITEVILAVNRPYKRSDYIPCIAWGRTAKMLAKMNVGEKVKLTGRVQSREYKKTLPDGTSELRTAYEVSISLAEKELDYES